MKLERYAIVLIVLGMMMSGIFYTQAKIGDKYTSYGVNLNVTGEERVTAIDEMNEIGSDLETKVTGLSKKVTTFDPTAIYDLAGLFVDVGAFLLKIPSVVAQTIQLAAGISKASPASWFISGLISLVTILVILKVVAIFLKREEL